MPERRHRYVPLADGADYATVSERTLRRMISAGEITGYRLGKRLIRIDLNELDALLKPIPATQKAG